MLAIAHKITNANRILVICKYPKVSEKYLFRCSSPTDDKKAPCLQTVLTVGIVTTPFAYEGKKRISQAQEGINKLKDYVDTLLVISNDKLRHQFGNLKMREAFEMADNVLATAAKCITDVISSTGQINVDFADVCTVMRANEDGGHYRPHDVDGQISS